MTRNQLLWTAVLVMILASPSGASGNAIKDSWIGLDASGNASQPNLGLRDPSTDPPTTLLDMAFSLGDAQIGPLGSPAGPLSAMASALSIVNAGSNGLGDAATFDVRYGGSVGDFPVQSSFSVDVNFARVIRKMIPITQPETSGGERLAVLTSVEQDALPTQYLLITFDINPLQPLSFSDGFGNADNVGLSFFDVFAELTATGPIDSSQPLFTVTMTSVPEPSGIATAFLALVALGGWGWTRRERQW